jgi:Flp pilus assembly protein TadG
VAGSGRVAECGRRLAGERGSFAVELAVLAPVLLAFVLVIVDGGRLTWARSRLQGAARDAARTVTINHNSGPAAFDSAYQAVLGSLAGSGVNCADPALELVPDPRVVPIGSGATVTATVTCQVRFVLFGTERVSRSQQSVVDRYRQVTTGPGEVP